MEKLTTLTKSFTTFISQHRWWVILTSLVLIASIGLTIVLVNNNRTQGVNLAPQLEELSATSRDIVGEKPADLSSLGVLLLGYGGAGHQGGALTDVIQLVYFDFENQVIGLISIPRDLWVQLSSGQAAKINTVFTSNTQTAKQMASVVTGLPVDYYAGIDFVGLQRLVGQDLDGLTVDVPEVLDDPWYPIKGEELNPCGMTPEEIAQISATHSGFDLEKQFPCRYEHVYYPSGPNHMEGGDVLKYVRSRHGSAGGDFSRSQRQHAVLLALKEKLISLNALAQAPTYFKAFTQHVKTDISLELIEYLVPALKLAQNFEIKKIVLSTENVLSSSQASNGQFIVIPQAGINHWQGVHQYIQAELNN